MPHMQDVPRDMADHRRSGDSRRQRDGRLLPRAGGHRRRDVRRLVPHRRHGGVGRGGYIHIVDRKKDIIISGGENISSIEVEKAISAHAAVLENCVVAAPDPKWGEVPVAFIVLKPGATLDEAALIEFLQQRLGKFKMPRSFHFRTEQLPKTGTGKILKRELREQFWAGKGKRVQG